MVLRNGFRQTNQLKLMLNKLNDIYEWVSQHKAALALAAGWFLHMGWPYIKTHGGLYGMLMTLWRGDKGVVVTETATEVKTENNKQQQTTEATLKR